MKNSNLRRNIQIFDENGFEINHFRTEFSEQKSVIKWLKSTDVVLELGARYGIVSCVINKIQKNKKNLVVVEPDNLVLNSLKRNRDINDCEFHIIEGLISKRKMDISRNGFGTQTFHSANGSIECFELSDIEKKFNLKFNALVVDCEGCLEFFIKENEEFITQLDTIIFECDAAEICDYNYINSFLVNNNFIKKQSGFINVFKKSTN